MLGKLSELQIQELLSRQITGRLGFYYRGETFIIPVNYIYKSGIIYAHSGPGHKIKAMRRNPKVCFEVEEIDSLFRWKSVLLWGDFEEITDEAEKSQAVQGLVHRLMPLVNNPENHPWHGITADENQMGVTIQPIVYKIKVNKTSGRFESA